MSDVRGGVALDLLDLEAVSGRPGLLQPMFETIRRQLNTNVACRGRIRHYFDIILIYLQTLRYFKFQCFFA